MRDDRFVYPGELKALAVLFLATGLLLALALLQLVGAFLMKRCVLVGAIALAAVALSGCGTLGRLPVSSAGSGNSGTILGNLSECTRDYKGSIGGLSFNGSVEIHCEPQGKAAKPASTAPAGGAIQ